MIRPESSPAQVDSGAKVIRVKEGGGSIYRMKWNGGAYEIVPPAIQVYENSGDTPVTFEAGEERLAFWRPAAQRYETIKPGEDGEGGGGGGGALFADCVATATSGAASSTITANIEESWGGTPGSTTGITVHKLSDHKVSVFSGDKFRAAWDPAHGKWKLFWFSGMRITIRGTLPSGEGGTNVTPSTSDFTLTDLLLVNGWRIPGSITVTNDPPIYAAAGSVVYARFNLTIGTGALDCWDTGDVGNFLALLKGVGGWAAGGEIQFLVDEKDNNPDFVTPDNASAGSVQVLGRNASNDLEWYTAIECNPAP